MMEMGDGTRISMKEIKDLVVEPLDRYIYILQRYGVSTSLAFVYTPADVHCLPKRIKESVRKSDEVVRIHDELFVVFYNHIDYIGAHKGCQKMIHDLSKHHKPVHASILEIHVNETAHNLISKSMHLLNEVKDNAEPSLEDIVAYDSMH